MKDWTKTCTVCGKTDCTIGGMHGMIRDRAATAYRQAQDPDQRPDGPRVDGMTPRRAKIVAAWGKGN